MNFSEQPPSEDWVTLTCHGEKLAVWFKPDGDPCALMFRIPQESFHRAGMDQLLTAANLLKAVELAPAQVESWQHDDICHWGGEDGPDPELSQPLPAPPPDVDYLEVHFWLKPPSETAASDSAEGPEALTQLQDLETRWAAILTLETAIDQMRARVESAQGEMDAATQRMLSPDEKVHASNLDVLNWNKAKARARYASPKAKEFVHRATWTLGTPERKKLGELFKDGARPDMPQMEKLPNELAQMLKAHQVLSAQGGTIYQECKSITTEIQGTLRTLLNNATANAQKKRVAMHKKGKFV